MWTRPELLSQHGSLRWIKHCSERDSGELGLRNSSLVSFLEQLNHHKQENLTNFTSLLHVSQHGIQRYSWAGYLSWQQPPIRTTSWAKSLIILKKLDVAAETGFPCPSQPKKRNELRAESPVNHSQLSFWLTSSLWSTVECPHRQFSPCFSWKSSFPPWSNFSLAPQGLALKRTLPCEDRPSTKTKQASLFFPGARRLCGSVQGFYYFFF